MGHEITAFPPSPYIGLVRDRYVGIEGGAPSEPDGWLARFSIGDRRRRVIAHGVTRFVK